MYWSFSSIPEIRKLPRNKRISIYKKLADDLNIAKKHTVWIVAAFTVSAIVSVFLTHYGFKDDLLGALSLFGGFLVWFFGYIRVLNNLIVPEVKRMMKKQPIS